MLRPAARRHGSLQIRRGHREAGELSRGAVAAAILRRDHSGRARTRRVQRRQRPRARRPVPAEILNASSMTRCGGGALPSIQRARSARRTLSALARRRGPPAVRAACSSSSAETLSGPRYASGLMPVQLQWQTLPCFLLQCAPRRSAKGNRFRRERKPTMAAALRPVCRQRWRRRVVDSLNLGGNAVCSS